MNEFNFFFESSLRVGDAALIYALMPDSTPDPSSAHARKPITKVFSFIILFYYSFIVFLAISINLFS